MGVSGPGIKLRHYPPVGIEVAVPAGTDDDLVARRRVADRAGDRPARRGLGAAAVGVEAAGGDQKRGGEDGGAADQGGESEKPSYEAGSDHFESACNSFPKR
jgi:hypothetical protein